MTSWKQSQPLRLSQPTHPSNPTNQGLTHPTRLGDLSTEFLGIHLLRLPYRLLIQLLFGQLYIADDGGGLFGERSIIPKLDKPNNEKNTLMIFWLVLNPHLVAHLLVIY